LSNFEESSDAKLCKSNFVHEGRCKDILFIAEDKKTTASFECLDATDSCTYHIEGTPAFDPKKPNENTITQDCECSKTAEPKAYCPLDTVGAKGQAKLAEAKKTIVLNVHTVRRTDESKVSKDYYFPKFEQATDNVFKTHIKYDFSNSSSLIKISVVALLLIFGL